MAEPSSAASAAPLVSIEIGDQDLGALLDEATNGAGANAARATRDRGDLAPEPVHVLPPGVV